MAKKRIRGSEIDKEILEYLNGIEFSATTEMVANAVGVAWYTAQMHLIKLADERKLKKFRVGRQNQWIPTNRLR